MPVVTLTEISVRNLKPKPGAQVIYTDKSLKGFGVRVTEGHKAYVLTYGPQRKRVKLGDVGVLPLKDARDKARTILAQYQLHGEDTTPELTFGEAVQSYLSIEGRTFRPGSYRQIERLLRVHFLKPLGHKPLADIKTGELMAIVDKLTRRGVHTEALQAYTRASTFFRWCARRRYIERSPLADVPRPVRGPSRDRVLSDTEMAQILTTARSRGDFGQIVELMLLTAQREGQWAQLRREWIHGDMIVWPKEAMKGGKEHRLPLTQRVRELLATRPSEGLLFPSAKRGVPWNNWSLPKVQFDEACPIPHWTLHDLRRSAASKMAELGVAPHVIERILAHSSGVISGVAAIYNRHSYLKEMREALCLWERHLAAMIRQP